jgi:hypothetical protein
VSRRWWLPRLLLTLLVALAAVGVMLYEHVTPDPVRLLLMVGVGVCALALVVETTAVASPDWEVVTAHPVRPAGQDPGLGRNVRLLENHLTARVVEPALQRRLVLLTEARLAELGLRRGDPGVDERLGPTLCEVLDSGPRQLGRRTLEECIRRIEELAP